MIKPCLKSLTQFKLARLQMRPFKPNGLLTCEDKTKQPNSPFRDRLFVSSLFESDCQGEALLYTLERLIIIPEGGRGGGNYFKDTGLI